MSGDEEEFDEHVEGEEEYSEIELLNQLIDARFDALESTLSNPDLPLARELNKTLKVAEHINQNMTKFTDMLKEFKGSIAICRSLLRERNDMTPRWYKLGVVEAPTSGEIWVRDIDGNETIATCQGKAIVYPASSSLKAPLFWKPV
jgi:hypothetical protein